MITSLVFLMLQASVTGTLLENGDFEKGLTRWTVQNAWYESPKGTGLAEVLVAAGEGRQGSKALKIVGKGKRGIAIQAPAAYPGRYRATGWIKCQDIEAGRAVVMLEWIDGKGKWMRGDSAVQVSGTRDWQRFDAVLEAPTGARSVHFDLLTTAANQGVAWFDDLTLERLPSNLPQPQAPKLTAGAAAGREDCLEVIWDPKKLAAGTCRLLIYCKPGAPAGLQDLPPKAVADSDEGKAILGALANAGEYSIAAVAVNADGKRSAFGEAVRAAIADRQAPRPGSIEARRVPGGQVRVSWSPHLLDLDVKTAHVCLPGEGKGQTRELAAFEATYRYGTPRPLYCTVPWAVANVRVPEQVTKIGVWCEDEAGNRGEIGWTAIIPARPKAGATAPYALWTVPPTEQIRRDAPAPAHTSTESPANFSLTLMREQAKGFQVVVRPTEPLQHVQVAFDSLVHEDGKSRIDTRWLAYHFVDYVRIEKNSRATPKNELVWPGPADYPDELSDDPTRDIPAGQVQPIYVRVTAPREAEPGLYRGRGRVESDQGVRQFEFSVRVLGLTLPEQPRLKFVYWFSWGAPCKQFGVEQYSADGWRVLARLGELMRTHHQNTVVVPWDLVRSWRKPDGGLVHDYADFDRFVRTFQAQGVDRLFALGHIGSRTTGDWACPTMGSHRHAVRRTDTGEREQVDLLDLLPAMEQHLREMGWLDRFAVHVADEPIPQNVESYRQLSARVKRAAPHLPRIDAIHVPNLDGALEIWVPQLNYFEKWLNQFRAAQRQGNELWFYIAWVPQGRYPNRMIDSQAIKSRVLHWLNATYDTTGYLHWALNHWQIPLSSLESPGDQYICWPSRRFVANSSLRYEAEREGLEDCESMFMLREALEKRGIARAEAQRQMETVARKAVRNIQDYTRRWHELEQVRLELLTTAAAAIQDGVLTPAPQRGP